MPTILPAIVRLCPAPGETVFEPLSDKRFQMASLFDPHPLALVVVIRLFDSASVEPLSVNVAVRPTEPSFVNDRPLRLIVPISLVFVV